MGVFTSDVELSDTEFLWLFRLGFSGTADNLLLNWLFSYGALFFLQFLFVPFH